MNKFLTYLKASLSGILLIVSTIPVQTSFAKGQWNPERWLFCDILKGDYAKDVYKAKETDYVPFNLSSKASLISSSTDFNSNLHNKILKYAGYEIAEKGQDATTPFNKFGLAGITLSSYRGEWKYYDVDPCSSNTKESHDTPGSNNTDSNLSEAFPRKGTKDEKVVIPGGEHPSPKASLTSPFGMRVRNRVAEMHTGADLSTGQETPFVAMWDGTVDYSGYTIAGRVLVVNHGTIDGRKVKTLYLHNSKNLVEKGDKVKQGQVIGHEGNTGSENGYSEGNHIHFELIVDDYAVDPVPSLNAAKKDAGGTADGSSSSSENSSTNSALVKVNDFGIFYEDRKEPIYSHAERTGAKDPRVLEHLRGDISAFTKAFLDITNNIGIWTSKTVVTITLAIIGLSLSDLSSLIGLGEDFQTEMIKNFHESVFMPLVAAMMLLTAIYLMYHGLVKRQYRQAVIGGLVQTIGSFFLAIVLSVNPTFASIPNKVSIFGQSLILSVLSSNISGDGEHGLCSVAPPGSSKSTLERQSISTSQPGNFDATSGSGSQDFLTQHSTYMKSVLGCRIWSEYLFKPLVIAQFGTEYDELEDLPNANEEWVGKPTVFLSGSTIENWGLLHVSILSGNHTSVDLIDSPLINNVHKDFYRIVDALSNYDDVILKGNKGLGDKNNSISTSGDGYGSAGDFLKEGTEANKVAKEVFKIFTEEYGFSGAAAAGILANIQGESGFIPDIGEGGKRMGMNNRDGETYNTANPNQLGGGGLFQFTPYTKFSHSEYFGKIDKEGWGIANQIAFVWDSEFRNRQVESYMIGNSYRTGKWNPIFTSIEDFLSTDDPAKASAAFQVGYERPLHYHPEREEWAKQANEVFNKDNVKADPSKWKFDKNGGNTASSYQAGGQLETEDYPEPLDNPVLEQWDYWIGNMQGIRFTYVFFMLTFSIIGSILPLIFSLYAAAYGIGITILSILAPIFLLLGCWGGQGNMIMKNWFGSLLSLIIKRTVITLLLVISIIITTNTFALISEIGYIKTLVVVGATIIIFIKKRDDIVEQLSHINIGQLNLSHFKESVKKTTKIATGSAKATADIAVAGAAGAHAAKEAGGSGISGAKAAMLGEIKNKSLRTDFGRKVENTRKAVASTSNMNTEGGAHTCVECLRVLSDDITVYFDNNGNPFCDDCASLRGYDNMEEYIVDNVNENEATMQTSSIQSTKVSYDSATNEVKYSSDTEELSYTTWTDLDEAGLNSYSHYGESWTEEDRSNIKQQIYDSMSVIDKNIDNAETYNLDYTKAVIPEVLQGFVNNKSIDTKLKEKDYNGFIKEIEDGWQKFYKYYYIQNNKEDDELLEENLGKDLAEMNEVFSMISKVNRTNEEKEENLEEDE